MHFALAIVVLLPGSGCAKGDKAGLVVRVLKMGQARISSSAYDWKPLAGVIVEIEGAPGKVLICDRSTITAKNVAGKRIPLSMMFSISGDHLTGRAQPGTSLVGLDIEIGGTNFQAYGSAMAMATLFESGKGGVTFTFEEGGKLQLGFLFRENADSLRSLSVGNQVVKLEVGKTG
jgi:hypothetical protein